LELLVALVGSAVRVELVTVLEDEEEEEELAGPGAAVFANGSSGAAVGAGAVSIGMNQAAPAAIRTSGRNFHIRDVCACCGLAEARPLDEKTV
jgi:hypothetical protein